MYRKGPDGWSSDNGDYVWSGVHAVAVGPRFDLVYEEDIGTRMPPEPAFLCKRLALSPDGTVSVDLLDTVDGSDPDHRCAPDAVPVQFSEIVSVVGDLEPTPDGSARFTPVDSEVPPMSVRPELAREIMGIAAEAREIGPRAELRVVRQFDGWHALDWSCIGECRAPETPPRPTDAQSPPLYAGGGTEPFWGLTITGGRSAELTFADPEGSYAWVADRTLELGVPWILNARSPKSAPMPYARESGELEVTVVRTTCSDGMSNAIFSHEVTVNGLHGCLEPIDHSPNTDP